MVSLVVLTSAASADERVALRLVNATEEVGLTEAKGDRFSFGDYDNDGDLDLLVVNLNDSPRLLRNDGGSEKRWLAVDARLAGGRSHAVGARVTVKTGSLVQVRDVIPVTGFSE